VPLNPADRLGPYEILALVDGGGMGEVYKARDTRLGRLVAVKVLTGLGRDDAVAAERFRREAQAAGSLNHPNVLLVHDIGEVDGLSYLVSELIEGGTLRERLGGGALPASTVIDYGIQIARGLQAAHERGIVHRDLKPENVMLTGDGRVKIVDFGLATLDPPLDAGGQAGITTGAIRTLPGTVMGTVAYMSPEQIRGAAIDHRSDIFSLGVILFEAIEGTRPFGGDTGAELIASILRDQAPRPRFAPPSLERIICRCLEKAPGARYQAAAELAGNLEAASRQQGSGPAQLPRVVVPSARTIAVLPFANVSADPENEYFSDGLTEELIHELGRVRGLQVVAWNSVAKLKGRTNDVQAAGAELGATTLLTGSVRRAGDRVRIVAKLVETVSGYLLWSETYDRKLEDLFAIQEDIARAIVGTLAETLQLSQVVGSRPSGSQEAHNLYLKGRYFLNTRTKEGLEKSVGLFEQAIAADPGAAFAHAGLADACVLLAEYGFLPPAASMDRARQAALDALAIDPRSAEAHASFGLIRATYDWEWLESEALFRRSLELNPGYAAAHHWFAVDFLGAMNRLPEAHEEIEIARRLDPLSLITAEGQAYLYMIGRRYEEAAAAFRGLLELDPTFHKVNASLGRAYSLMGRYDDAVAMFEKARQSMGDVPSILAALGQTHAMAGRADSARAMLGRLHEIAAVRYVQSTGFALVHAGLGELDTAIDWIERSVERRDLSLPLLNVHPAYDALRGHPRFSAILKLLRLETA
jgi:serine/threonine protein kinase/tetratricopeptide (TPR) repeat protein